MPTVDLLTWAAKRDNRLRYSGGEVVDWVLAGESPGITVARSDRWRIIRVTGLSEDEATMLVASDPLTMEDLSKGIQPRRRMWKLPLRLWLSGARDKDRRTVFDHKITRRKLFDVMILKDEELRDIDGNPVLTPEPDHDIGTDNR